MKRPHYDRRMHPLDNWRYGVWKPFICWLWGHRMTCYGITPGAGIISGYVYICGRCVEMTDHDEPCGQCNNGCRDNDEGEDEGYGGLRVR